MNSRKVPLAKFFALLPSLLLIGMLYPADAGTAEPSSVLTLERIFSTNEFHPERFGPARWLRLSTAYTTLEDSPNPAGGRDIVQYNPKTGQRIIRISAENLIPAGEKTPLAIEDYQWSPSGKLLLIFTNSQQVWRLNTRGDYWVLNLETLKLEKLGGDAPPSSLMFAKFSPDNSRVAYVRANNLYTEDLATHAIVRLTADGSETIINGSFDWVYEEEFHLRDGFRWSPDSQKIAYWRLDAAGVGVFHLINNTDSLYPKIIPIQYPKAGTINSAAQVGVVPVSGGDTRWIQLPGDPRQHYIAFMDWAANANEIVLQRLNRKQNRLWVILADSQSGRPRTILEESDETWVDVVADFHWLDNGRKFTWLSDRDGWRRLYTVSRDTGALTPVTQGPFDVADILSVDGKNGWVYYTAAPDNAATRSLFRSRLSGARPPERLTPTNQPGFHHYQLSHDCRWAIHRSSQFGVPPISRLIHLPDHKPIRLLAANQTARQNAAALRQNTVEFFPILFNDPDQPQQKVRLDAWCMKPPDFDPSRKYPVLFYVYGEPWGQTVTDSWGGNTYLWHLFLTQQGYVVMSVDNRGTAAPRGREFRKCIYRKVGVISSADQAQALREIIASRPWVDPSRIAIWGWSGGGSMTLNAIFRYPDLYQTGIAVAAVPDQRYYDTIYQERYMGLPSENAEDYKNGSPITFARQLKGNLLLVHGSGDDNVHYQGVEALINKLVEHEKTFTMMAYPNRSHSISEGANTTIHLFRLLTSYLTRHTPPGPR